MSIRLCNSGVLVKRTVSGFYPASSEVSLTYDVSTPDDLAPHKDKLLRICQECEWLISHGLEINWIANGYEKYQRLLRDKGLASFQGKCNYTALEAAFNDYWGKEFLETLFRETSDSRFKGWFYKIARDKIQRFIPLYHILLMCFLSGSVNEFVKSDPADTPYGSPPFVCENPICPHYHVNGAEMVSLKYYSAGVTAAFECIHCGMRYKHNKAKYSRELRVVVDYGHLWNSELIRCSQDPAITNEQAMKILKCSMNVLLLQKKKHGLLERPLYDTEIGPEAYYEAQVTALCEEYEEVTIALLQNKVPGAYSYLGDHDYGWLRSRIVFESELKHRREHNERLLNGVRRAVDKFEKEGYPKRQITFGYLACVAGVTRDELRRSGNPQLRALLDVAIESKEMWLRRRIGLAFQNKPVDGRLFSLVDLKRDLYLNKNTYLRYHALIEEVIEELNKNIVKAEMLNGELPLN